MKKVNVLGVCGVLILALTNTVFSQEKGKLETVIENGGIKIGIIDGRRIFEAHPDSKSAQELLKKELNERQKKIDAYSEEIRRLEGELKSNLLLSDEERAKKEGEINEKKRAVLKYGQEAEEYLAQKEEELTKQITEKVYWLIKQVAQQKGINIILESNYVLYADDNLDITEEVIAKIKSIPKKETKKP